MAAMIVIASAGSCLAASTRVGIVALGLWSDQGVFRSEATRGASLLAARYHAAKVVVRTNTAKSFAAGPAGMLKAIRLAGAPLDPERDVLIVVLTSHGSPDGIAEKGAGVEGLLAPKSLADLLAQSPVRRKVLIVSACFSGIFAPLATPDLLVITAADATHPSFGCTATATWTYFGRAFFDQALRAGTPAHATMETVFDDAAKRVRLRETQQGFDPSNPQIAGGADVLAALDAIR